jgi:hypothetical protein
LSSSWNTAGFIKIVGFKVLTAVVMESTIFWDITPCSPLKVNGRFGGTYHLYLQGRRIREARNSVIAGDKQSFHDGFLLGLFFDSDDGADIFLRKVAWLSTDYMALYPRKQYTLLKLFSF